MKLQVISYIIPILLVSFGCSPLPSAEDPPLVENLPSVQSLIDSLVQSNNQVIKWSQSEESITYTSPQQMDWSKEFKAFERDNVNKLRYADAYSIEDVTENTTRTVTFTALSEAQEIQKMVYTLTNKRLTGLSIMKDRSNLFSTSKQTFIFDGNTYSLSVDQRIPWFFSNQQFIHATIIPPGEQWRAEFLFSEAKMPVQCLIQADQLLVKNADEWVVYALSGPSHDSIQYSSIHFNSSFVLASTSDSTMAGRWVNAKNEKPSSIPVLFKHNITSRFNVKQTTNHVLADKYMLLLDNPRLNKTDTAMLVLTQNHHEVMGSILTETGDYRWLDGVIRNDSLLLSSMDGTHAYLVSASIKRDSLIGAFYSGMSWKQNIKAVPDSNYELKSPERITYLKPEKTFDFSFPEANGNLISLADSAFRNKVVIVTIMGTWCSNCLDETRFLAEVRKRYSKDVLSIVALDFELIGDSARAWQNIEKYKQSLGIDYPVLLASLGAGKEEASAALPSLNGVFSYPTMIILTKDHAVERIHTGFSGPATGEAHLLFKKEYLGLLDALTAR